MNEKLETAFPLHCELSVREFAKMREARAAGDLRAMRFHLEQATMQFNCAEQVLIETANLLVIAEQKVEVSK